ncbi:hypothetical protein CCMSSC00406_0009872 [Pleurotus cornucopiae]|uniref:Uncharacterized protein n=1 Tax=Pleurotus cornucopiae TaxID=5321 RepID=A0ACB7IQ68_PLECO|nr:hypothetical protein CCMSSC00406_0009872 [Pleurotus cornucopiae]
MATSEDQLFRTAIACLSTAFLLTAMLYGVSLLLIGLYFLSPTRPNDPVFVKSTVASLGILATAEIVILSFGIYHKIVDPFKPSQTLNVESMGGIILGVSLMAFIAQLFFASRIWIVSSSRWLYAGPIVILALTQFGVALAQVITEANLDGINLFWSSVRFMSVQTGTTALADILSSIGLCYTLQSSRSGISRTDAVIGKLMKYSIHQAIATTAAAVLTVALLVSISQTTAFMIPLLVSGQLYVISVVATPEQT